jgi:WD40 repeat protein
MGLEKRRKIKFTKVCRLKFQNQFNIEFSFSRGHNDKIFCLRWNPHDDDRCVTVGVKHIKFWTKAGGSMTAKQGVFGKVAGKPGKQNQMCVVFGKTADVCITGGGDGAIFIWNLTTLIQRIENAHVGPLFAITAVQEKVRLVHWGVPESI